MDSIDQIIIGWFNSGFGTNLQWAEILGNLILVILSLLLAALFSGVIGFEREYHGHSAGLRTHLLVAIGSALIMIISVYGFSYWDSLYTAHSGVSGSSRDPARLAAQVVTGIGFLGAGTIVQNGVSVKGLTTATTIWVAMAIGLACGSGCFVIAAIATVIAFIALVSMRKIEKFASRRNPVVMIVVPSDKPIMKDILLIANRYGINLRDTSSELVTYQDSSALRMVMRCSYASQASVNAFVDEVRISIHPLELKVSTEA
jgi:putative Mg2+ transporter-C (MgtC) family protein